MVCRIADGICQISSVPMVVFFNGFPESTCIWFIFGFVSPYYKSLIFFLSLRLLMMLSLSNVKLLLKNGKLIFWSLFHMLSLLQERERQFEIDIRRAKGLEVKRMQEDGNCLFRAVADQVYGDSEAYDLTRQMCIDYMVGALRIYILFLLTRWGMDVLECSCVHTL